MGVNYTIINNMICYEFAKELIEEYGSPLVVYSAEQLEANYMRLKNALPKNAQIVYSVKANPNPMILKLFYRLGAFFETASEKEFDLVLSVGICVKRVIYSGQAKTKEGVTNALTNGVFLFNLESLHEVKMLVELTSALDREACILCRINPNCNTNNAVLKMGGTPSAFGMDENEIENAIALCKDSKVLLSGLFMYNGSQYYDPKSIYDNSKYLYDLSLRIMKSYNLKFNYIDYGGGFGVIENENQNELNMDELKQMLDADSFKTYAYKTSFFESGRYLTNSAGIVLTTVRDVKKSKNQKYVILDAGINILGIRQYCYRLYQPFLHSFYSDREKEKQIFVGPTCTTIDNVHEAVDFDKLEIGDVIAITEAGSYLLSYSPLFFCGQEIPREVLVDEQRNTTVNRIGIDYYRIEK